MAQQWEFFIDESGEFEKSESPQPPVRLIGGVLMPPELKARELEVENALKPIRKLYFPGQKKTHVSELRDHKAKKDLRERMRSVFQEKMPEAKIAFIYDLSVLSDDPACSGAQLYRNMLVKLLRAVLFYHPFFGPRDHVRCNVAHRRFPYLTKFEDVLAGQGYLKLKDFKGRTEFTAITQADLLSIMQTVRQSLRFLSQRQDEHRVLPYSAWTSPFMEVADWICYEVRDFLCDGIQPMTLLKQIQGHLGHERILFFCPSEYELPEASLNSFHANQAGRFLSLYLEQSGQRPSATAGCDHLLLKPGILTIFQRLQSSSDADEIRPIVALANNLLENKEFYRLDEVQLLIKLVEKRLDLVDQEKPDPVWDRLAFDYHDVCIRYCNHTANAKAGKIHREKALKLYGRIRPKNFDMIRAFHALINRISIWDANEFAFDRGNAFLAPFLAKEEQFSELMSLERNDIQGKIYGTMGQNHAFAGRLNEAAQTLEMAGKHLGMVDVQQNSYRAHLAVERRDRDAYETEMALLFRRESFPGFPTITQDCIRGLPKSAFDLHLILKGLLTFSETKSEQDQLARDIHARIHAEPNKYKEKHPWELIWTTLGRLFQNVGKVDLARKYWRAAASFTDNPDKLVFVMLGHSARGWEALTWLKENNPREASQCLKPVAATFSLIAADNSALGIFNPNREADEDGVVRAGWFDKVGRRFLSELDGATPETLRRLVEAFVDRFSFNYW